MKYVGFCIWTSGGMHGTLVREEPEGWVAVAGHLSSDQWWSERDLFFHFEKRNDPQPDDTFAWYGYITTQVEMDEFMRTHRPKEEATSNG